MDELVKEYELSFIINVVELGWPLSVNKANLIFSLESMIENNEGASFISISEPDTQNCRVKSFAFSPFSWFVFEEIQSSYLLESIGY